MRRLTVGVAAGLVVAACSSIAPYPISAGDVCFRCRRVIVETRVAAQIIDGSLRSNFRSAGCLAKYLADHPEDKSAVFVTDFASGKLVPSARAIFVATLDRNTGERDFVAFVDRAAADREALERHTSPISWDGVLQQARQAERGN